MKARILAAALIGASSLPLGACADRHEDMVAPAPPMGPGAIPGTVAADRNGDGIPDGWYTPDGSYHPFIAPPCPPPPPPPPPPSRCGERG